MTSRSGLEGDEVSHILPPVSAVRPISEAEAQDLEERFRNFAAQSAEFRNEVLHRTGFAIQGGTRETAQINLEIARTIFSKWSLEIMVILYTRRAVRFGELRRLLGGISSRVLSGRLKTLEDRGFVQRSILGSRPPRVVYVLTSEGHTVSRLGEPVFLYLRVREAYGSRLSPPKEKDVLIPSIIPTLPPISPPTPVAPRRRIRAIVP